MGEARVVQVVARVERLLLLRDHPAQTGTQLQANPGERRARDAARHPHRDFDGALVDEHEVGGRRSGERARALDDRAQDRLELELRRDLPRRLVQGGQLRLVALRRLQGILVREQRGSLRGERRGRGEQLPDVPPVLQPSEQKSGRRVGLQRDRERRLRTRSACHAEARLDEPAPDADGLPHPHGRLPHHVTRLTRRDFDRLELFAHLLGEKLPEPRPITPEDGPFRLQEADGLVANLGGEGGRADSRQVERGQPSRQQLRPPRSVR